MIVNFPTPPSGFSQSFMIQVLDMIRKAFVPVVSKDTATPRILLLAPNGTVYELTVSNTGVLTTAVNDGKTRDI